MDLNPEEKGERPERTALPVEPDHALNAAAATLQRAIENPAELALANAQLRSAVKGAHALLHALVKQTSGVGVRVKVNRQDFMAINPAEELEVITDAEGDVHLYIKRLNRQQRRADAKAK